MLSLPLPVRIFFCTQHADMRRSFDGLAQIVREHLHADPLSGHLFVFRSRRGDRVKLLYWDDHGYAIWYKRLDVFAYLLDLLTHSPRPGLPGYWCGLFLSFSWRRCQ